MAGFFSDLLGGFTDSTKAQINKGSAAGAPEESYGTQMGQAFFSLTKQYFESGNLKEAAVARIKASDTVQKEIAKEKTATIQAFIRDPKTWLIGGLVVLVIAWVGFTIGKR